MKLNIMPRILLKKIGSVSGGEGCSISIYIELTGGKVALLRITGEEETQLQSSLPVMNYFAFSVTRIFLNQTIFLLRLAKVVLTIPTIVCHVGISALRISRLTTPCSGSRDIINTLGYVVG